MVAKHRGGQFVTYKNTESLWHKLETTITLYAN